MGIAGRGRAHVAAALAQLVRRGRKSLEQIYPKACSPTKPTEQGCMIPEKNRIYLFLGGGAWNPDRCSLALSAVNMILGSLVSTSLRWFLIYKSAVSPFSVVHVSRSSTDLTEQLSLSLLVFGRRACIVMRSFVAFIYLP